MRQPLPTALPEASEGGRGCLVKKWPEREVVARHRSRGPKVDASWRLIFCQLDMPTCRFNQATRQMVQQQFDEVTLRGFLSVRRSRPSKESAAGEGNPPACLAERDHYPSMPLF